MQQHILQCSQRNEELGKTLLRTEQAKSVALEKNAILKATI